MSQAKLIWFIDSRASVKTPSLVKVTNLARKFTNRLEIVFDKRIRSAERWYWPSFDHDKALRQEFELAQKNTKNQLSTYLLSHHIDFHITEIEDSDYLTPLKKLVDGSPQCLVVIDDNGPSQRHPIFQSLATLGADVLLLSAISWNKKIKMLGAVDPLHEHARPFNIDEHIVNVLREWNQKLTTDWSIAHCCFIASVLYKHEKTILKMHREEFSNFAKSLKISNDKMYCLEGLPEKSLKSHIRKNNINILVVGLIARNVLEQMWVGSTTVALMNNPPCDMLLVTH